MKLLGLLLIPLSAVYAETLTYPDDITSFKFDYTNNGVTGSGGPFSFTDNPEGFLTDGQLATVDAKLLNKPDLGTWNAPNGLVGDFQAVSLKVPDGYIHWKITKAKIYFNAVNCWNDATKGAAQGWYTDSTKTFATISSREGDNIVFTAELRGGFETKGPITFHVQSNEECEGDYKIVEFELEGELVLAPTPEPTTKAPTTKAPTTKAPTTKEPTTKEPTKKPTKKPTPVTTENPHECTGMFAFGDPHYLLMAGGGSRHGKAKTGYAGFKKFDYQGSGWHYYYAPCDLSKYEEWPFFLLSKHDRWKKGRTATTVVDNRLVLNTKPTAWVLEYTDKRLKVNIGTGATGNSPFIGRSSRAYTQQQLKQFGENNPLEIEYDDNNGQSGVVKVWMETANPRKLVINIGDLGYSSNNNGDCDGEVMEIRSHASWLVYTCPECMYGEACGLMGKYIHGDCTKAEFDNKNHPCHHVLVGSDGEIYNAAKVNRNKLDNKAFVPFAKTWHKNEVEKNLKNNHGITNFAGDHVAWPDAKYYKNRDFNAMSEGRAIDIDFTVFEGDCANNPARVLALNGTCNEHTWGRYKDCCEKIGYCDMLWESCIFDMCYCPEDEQEDCLHGLIHATLNDTCSYKRFFPQATKDPNFKEGLDRLDDIGTVPIILICIAVAIGVLVFAYSICRWAMGKRDERNRYHLENENLQEMDGVDTGGYDMTTLDA